MSKNAGLCNMWVLSYDSTEQEEAATTIKAEG